MNEQKYEHKQLGVDDLLLNSSNPRFDPVRDQTEAIIAMIEDQKEKLVVMAEHIAEYGLNPTDIVLVQPQGNKWLVREGNRRITALKLANEPSLVPDTYRRIRTEFTRLNSTITSDIFSSIPCTVVNDERLANEWIRLKHTGENDGAGTVNWDAQQTSRFRLRIPVKSSTQSGGNRPLVPAQIVRLFRLKSSARSGAKNPVVPEGLVWPSRSEATRGETPCFGVSDSL